MENVRKARAEEITSLKAEVARATEEATSLREQAAASLESSRLLKKEAEARGKEATTLSLETAGLRAVEEALSRELSEARAEVARERQQAEDACNENAILRKEMTELIKSVDTERAAARLKAQTAASITKKLADAAADAAKGLVA
jgi:regulator of replication initiation timing